MSKINLIIIAFMIPFALFSQAKIWVRSGFPVGHCVVSVGDTAFFQFGNYKRFPLLQWFPSSGEVQSSKKQFKSMRRAESFLIDDLDGNSVLRFCDSLTKAELPYMLFSSNCATFACDAVDIDREVFPKQLGDKLRGDIRLSERIAWWSLMSFSGAIWGGREAFYADARVFERKWGVDPYSFFGSNQWERKYKNNRFLGEDGKPNQMKSQIFGNFGRDYLHTSKYVVFGISGSFLLAKGSSKTSFKRKAFDTIIGGLCFTFFSSITYKALRN